MPQLDFLHDPDWRRRVLRDAFGPGFWGFFAVAAAAGAACFLVEGAETFAEALRRDGRLVLGLLPRIMVALTIAALIWFMLPRDRLSALVGQDSGLLGLLVGTVAGAVTPGGPASAYALLGMLLASGAGRGAMVAYITSWALIGVQRILVWDVPFMGAEFAFLRMAISLPLPILAGLVAQRLPLELRVPEELKASDEAKA